MLFLHETHKIKGRCEDAFEDAIRDGWMARLAEGDSARLLWYANHAHGSGSSYQVVTVTGIADGAWEELARRIQSGDLQKFMRELDELRHDVEGKLLLPVYWSPLQSVDLATVPTDGLGCLGDPAPLSGCLVSTPCAWVLEARAPGVDAVRPPDLTTADAVRLRPCSECPRP